MAVLPEIWDPYGQFRRIFSFTPFRLVQSVVFMHEIEKQNL